MKWYTAHIIMYIRYTQHPQSTYPVYENMVLIEAESPQEAIEKAATKARAEYAGDSGGSLTSEDKPAEFEFAGVRKVVETEDPDEPPRDGTELSYTVLEARSLADVFKMATGNSVAVVYEDCHVPEWLTELNGKPESSA